MAWQRLFLIVASRPDTMPRPAATNESLSFDYFSLLFRTAPSFLFVQAVSFSRLELSVDGMFYAGFAASRFQGRFVGPLLKSLNASLPLLRTVVRNRSVRDSQIFHSLHCPMHAFYRPAEPCLSE